MNSPFSAQWFRVAHLRPRLATELRVQRQRVRGAVWHVLSARQDAATACRLNAEAYAVAARFDGSRSVQALWDELQRAEHDGPTQDDVLRTLLTLHEHRLIEFDQAPDFGALRARSAEDGHQPGSSAGRSFNPLFLRLPLGNPSRLLNVFTPLLPHLFGRVAAVLWTLAVLAMLAAAALHAGELQTHAQTWLSTPRYLLLAAALLVPIKALHELGHALAVRRHGGQVSQAGLSLMVLMPMPYVDASAATGFARAGQRALVSAAGIMVELGLASAGLALWFATGSGWLHDAGFVVWFIGCVSTLLFNANPLQRFDGYHLLCDVLQLPNLAPRSRAFWLDRLRTWALRRDDPALSMPTAKGERPWLWAYAPAAWLYQLLLLGALMLWLGGISQWLGWALGAWLIRQLLWPAAKMLRELWRLLLETQQGHDGQAAGMPRGLARLALVLAVPALILLLPLPDSSVVRGVVWARDTALLRAETEGFVAAVAAQDGAAVQAGDLLLELRNPRLQAERERVAAQLDIAEHEQFQGFGSDGMQSGNAAEDVQRLRTELARLDERLAGLQVRAQTAGRLVLPHAADLPGSYIKRGTLLGHVLTDEPTLLRVAVAHEEAVRLRERMRGLSAVLADGGARSAHAGELLRDAVGATRELPSAALSERHGGPVQTDPKDEQDRRTVEPVVVMDVLLPRTAAPATRDAGDAPGQRLGTRAWVRFDLGWTPLAAQALRWGRERVHGRFNASH